MQIKRTEFTTYDIQKALNLPRERFRDWINRGFVAPSVAAEGSGTKAIFTIQDVYGVALFRDLIEHGYSRDVASDYVKAFMKQLKKEKDNPDYEKTAYILYRVFVREGKEVDEALLLRPGAWKIDLESGNIDWALTNPKFKKIFDSIDPPPIKNKDWHVLHVVNFEALRKEVDAALARL
ncbi:MAG: hypothetical protein NTU69_11750 [Proteobacteria bacterium]|nr:hypothetical protein [Pseudomonadota bacterium]